MKNTSDTSFGLIAPEQFMEVMERVRKANHMTYIYNIAATVIIFVISFVAMAVMGPGYILIGLFMLACSVGQLIHTIRYKRRVISTEEIAGLPDLMDAVEQVDNPLLRRFVLFRKDGKWGVYDMAMHCIALEPVYDGISWTKKGLRMVLTRDGISRQARFSPATGKLKVEQTLYTDNHEQ